MFGLEPLPRSLEAALRDSADAKERVRISAVRDLARHAAGPGASRVVSALGAALTNDPSPEVRAAAAIALADSEAKDAVDSLLHAADDPDARVRQMVLLALGELGVATDERVAAVVESALEASFPALRYQALIAASRLDLPRTEDALLAATRDGDAELRHVSLRLLEERSTLAGAELRPSDAVLGAARARLDDPALSVRLASAILLGRAGSRDGARVLAEAIASRRGEVDPEDEQVAIVLAGELGIRDALPGLARRAFGVWNRGGAFEYESRIALARMGDGRARTAILRGLSAFTRDARTVAVAAAGKARIDEAIPLIQAMQTDERRADPIAVGEALLALTGKNSAEDDS